MNLSSVEPSPSETWMMAFSGAVARALKLCFRSLSSGVSGVQVVATAVVDMMCMRMESYQQAQGGILRRSKCTNPVADNGLKNVFLVPTFED